MFKYFYKYTDINTIIIYLFFLFYLFNNIMYTKDEKKSLRQKFWGQFKKYSKKRKLIRGKPAKWIMNDTGIKQLKLKFHFDENHAFAGFEIETMNLDKRIELYDKLEKLKTVISNAVPVDLQWLLEVPLTDKKTVSRIIAVLPDVNIYNTSHWNTVNQFLYNVMEPIEDLFLEYKDFLK